jgi:hypothetical protein
MVHADVSMKEGVFVVIATPSPSVNGLSMGIFSLVPTDMQRMHRIHHPG